MINWIKDTYVIVIPLYSYTGAAIVSVLTEMMVVSFTLYLTVKHLDYTPRIDDWYKFIFSGLAMALFLFIFQELNFFIQIFASAAIYFIILWLTRAISNNELMSIIKKG